ncbi:MAG: hypothetical protein PVH05_08855, partial [Burkholderiales bacterium]
MNSISLRVAEPFFAPAAVLVVAAVSALILPQYAVATAQILPAIVLPIGIFLSLWFNRGRAFLAMVTLFCAYAGFVLASRY